MNDQNDPLEVLDRADEVIIGNVIFAMLIIVTFIGIAVLVLE